MTLPEIFVLLPEPLQIALEKALNASVLPENPTRQQVYDATFNLIDEIVETHSPALSVERLLDKVPAAVADIICS